MRRAFLATVVAALAMALAGPGAGLSNADHQADRAVHAGRAGRRAGARRHAAPLSTARPERSSSRTVRAAAPPSEPRRWRPRRRTATRCSWSARTSLLPGAVPQSRLRSGEKPGAGRDRSSPGRMCWRWRRRSRPRPSPELVAYAKANPGKLTFGFGLGTMPHILGETFKQVTGIDIVSVPYRGGEDARADLLGGRIHINIAPVPQTAAADPRRQDPAARLHRAAAQPGPAGRPHHDRKRLAAGRLQSGRLDGNLRAGRHAARHRRQAQSRGERRACKSAEMAPALKRFGYEAKITTPAEFAAFFAAELRKWPPLLRAAGLKPQ